MKITSEAHFLEIVDAYFPNKHQALALGRGDDCAILKTNGNICISTDLFLENVHFRRSYFKPEDIGHKALAVNISDIAAMGARPLGFSLGLGLPENIDKTWLEKFFKGMSDLAKKFDVALVGGDVSSSTFIHICISIWGDIVKSPLKSTDQNKRKFLLRGGAMPQDIIFVVGKLGLARVGLNVLEAQNRNAEQIWPKACAAHLRPNPLINAGLIIKRIGIQSRPPVLMDISDGLAKDLPRLLGMNANKENMLGARLDISEAMLDDEVITYCREQGLCPITEAWLGGEDYALLGACDEALFSILRTALPEVQQIGIATEDGKIMLNGNEATKQGFDHFN